MSEISSENRKTIRTRLIVVQTELEAALALSYSPMIAQVLGTVEQQLRELADE